MNDSDSGETIRAIFRKLPGGGLRLRRPPSVKIDKRVLAWVFAPARQAALLLKAKPPEKPAPGRRNLHVVPRNPKK